MAATPKPWYRQLWPWLLTIPPLSAVVFWSVILATEVATPSLVVDDYSKIGLTYKKDVERAETAARLGVTGRLHVTRDDGHVTVVLQGLEKTPKRLQLTFVHPAEARRDVHMDLVRDDTGIYRGDTKTSTAGRWYVRLQPPDGNWRLTAELPANRNDLTLAPLKAASGSGRRST